ncbi:TPA: phosphoribosylformylglycinamidine synthase [Candidatus Daviesbacteria bacterium]|nr:MAG: phosphoribosylformylglycinamidine synthase [Candidatus Daviesbacteria bacterium RIFCSPHIGHO2_02_FULL_39_41]OGE28020.1 MAG: phosphoribosylformylglycinamidine synthase [Candidatus Daviesbacteria bacterium RIFCSPHIGHO2_01_FULL_38_8b]OGE44083.1 MAG: phosphoribosylformylglycinamidine synthase [Candidatus Daviesbacteria bacterium RIFCSPHIGHO2_12_FULL_38_25]OGE68268.1 MAG: phosphoribosylformylglycinamidine synthase [Candidatus Daviesbacteria bacterium RIFCSPLOWO2_02_FULL_38_18]OGE72261.1 MAG: 
MKTLRLPFDNAQGRRSGRSPKVCILRADGTNCDVELFYAFKKAGGDPEYVNVNQLRDKSKSMQDFQILALPGGFAYGDDIASGKIWAVELVSFFKDELEKFHKKDGIIVGICNGFQVLIRTGLLPFGNIGKMDATLLPNNSGHFECRWVRVRDEKSKRIFWMSINHGEGKFFANNETIKAIETKGLVIFRYIDNPNGSINDIAGVTDPTGRVIGLMPHPEKFMDLTQYPNWRRDKITKPHGSFIFEEMIKYAKENL